MNLISALAHASVPLDIGSRKKRSSIEIAAEVLAAARDGAKKTRIMYKANLSYEVLQQYLSALVDTGLLEGRDELGIFRPSRKGSKFLSEFNTIRKLQNTYRQKMHTLNNLVSH